MRIGVKFCGGCNQCYDRRDFLQKLQDAHPDVEFFFLFDGEEACDVGLLIRGCAAECIDPSQYQGRLGQLVVTAEEDFDEVSAAIARFAAEA